MQSSSHNHSKNKTYHNSLILAYVVCKDCIIDFSEQPNYVNSILQRKLTQRLGSVPIGQIYNEKDI